MNQFTIDNSLIIFLLSRRGLTIDHVLNATETIHATKIFFEMSIWIEQDSLHQTIHQELNLHPVKVQSLVSSAQGKYNKELMIQIEGRRRDLVQINSSLKWSLCYCNHQISDENVINNGSYSGVAIFTSCLLHSLPLAYSRITVLSRFLLSFLSILLFT